MPDDGRNRRSGPARLDGILAGVMARLGLDRDLDDYRIWEAWDEVVGAQVARNAQPLRLDNRRLVVAVKNAGWMQELTLLRCDVCRRLNEWMGREVVAEIFLVVGRVEPPRPAKQPGPAARRRSGADPPADEETTEALQGREALDAALERLWDAARRRGK